MSTLEHATPAKIARPVGRLVDEFQSGLDAPICLTWELTYACNLACVHCLSSSGRRDPRELSTDECKAVIDELQRMQVFYVNIGGGEPTVRPDFWELLDYAKPLQLHRETIEVRDLTDDEVEKLVVEAMRVGAGRPAFGREGSQAGSSASAGAGGPIARGPGAGSGPRPPAACAHRCSGTSRWRGRRTGRSGSGRRTGGRSPPAFPSARAR